MECTHCYADSGPRGDHGVMSVDDWVRVIGECAGFGVRMVRFIGGEPTLHPALPTLVRTSREHGLRVEVYSNLVHVPEHVWSVLSEPGVALATSYYSDDSDAPIDPSACRAHRPRGGSASRPSRGRAAGTGRVRLRSRSAAPGRARRSGSGPERCSAMRRLRARQGRCVSHGGGVALRVLAVDARRQRPRAQPRRDHRRTVHAAGRARARCRGASPGGLQPPVLSVDDVRSAVFTVV